MDSDRRKAARRGWQRERVLQGIGRDGNNRLSWSHTLRRPRRTHPRRSPERSFENTPFPQCHRLCHHTSATLKKQSAAPLMANTFVSVQTLFVTTALKRQTHGDGKATRPSGRNRWPAGFNRIAARERDRRMPPVPPVPSWP